MGEILIGSQKYEVSFSVSTTNSSQSDIWTYSEESGSRVTNQNFSITLRNGFTDIDVMEELMHAYLNTDVPGDTRLRTKMNGEIEAKLGWFMYRERVNNMDGVKNYIGFRPGYDQFDALSSCWHLEMTNSSNFTSAFREAGRLLKVYYKSYSDFPFSNDHINMDKLMQLMKDCEKDKSRKM